MGLISNNLAIGLIIFVIIVLMFTIVLSIIEIIGKWKLFKKAGKPGWASIIPYYNNWVLVEISGCKWWFFLIIIGSSLISLNFDYHINETTSIGFNLYNLLGSIVNFLGMLCVNYNISKKCNKDMAYAIGLTILPFIFYPMLGFGKVSFDNNIKVSPYGVIKEGDR